jgi:nitrate reductase NapD
MKALKQSRQQKGNNTMNVSSIVVKTTQEYIQEVIENINKVDFCEVHFNDADGKIVVTIEGDSINEQMERMKKIQKIPFVFSANVAYSYCEDELISMLAQIKDTGDPVPGELK